MIIVLSIIICFDCFNNFGLSGIGLQLLNALKIFSMLLTFLYIFLFKNELVEKDIFLALLLIPFIWVYYLDFDFLKGTLKFISRILPAMSFIVLDTKSKMRVGKIWLSFFVISLIPGLIIHLLKHFFSVTFPIIEMQGYEGKSFDTHFLVYWYNRYNPIRFCGIYDEPGVIGTFSILFLIFWGESMKKYQKFVLWLGGIASLSFFFFLMTPFFLIQKYLKSQNYIRLLVFFSLVGAIFVFKDLIISSLLNTTGRSKVEQEIIFQTISGRIAVNEGNKVEGIKSNRMESNNYQFKDFINDDLNTILFGNFFTKGEAKFVQYTLGGLGLELFLYNYGVILFLYALFFVLCLTTIPKRNGFFYLLFAFGMIMFCFYQRPFIYRIEFIAIIYTGLILNSEKIEHILSKRKLNNFQDK